MAKIVSAGFAVVRRNGTVRSLHLTWRGAQQGHRCAHVAGEECTIHEVWHSEGVPLGQGEQK